MLRARCNRRADAWRPEAEIALDGRRVDTRSGFRIQRDGLRGDWFRSSRTER